MWLIFPARCSVCGKVLNFGEYICEECNLKIERIDKICTACGNDKNLCTCKRQVFRFNSCIGAFNYGDNAMSAVKRFKFGNNLYIAEFLADEMSDKFQKHYNNIRFDAVTAVPMHPLKKFAKGYNQSEVIARKLCKNINLPYIKLLSKIRFNKTQHKQDRHLRFENIKGVFSAKLPYNIETVLLVDDIKSTGATLDECTRELMFAGVKQVYCITAILNGGGNGIEKT